jgi:hypothetical protein
VAARAPQEILTAEQALAFVERHGVVAESAKHAKVPSLAVAIAGAPIRGNWWTHPRAKTIFTLTRAVRESPDVLVCRIVDGKIGFVHRRLWPALVRVASRFPVANIARLREVHTADGHHRVEQMPFPDWVSPDVRAAAKRIREADALAAFAILLDEPR